MGAVKQKKAAKKNGAKVKKAPRVKLKKAPIAAGLKTKPGTVDATLTKLAMAMTSVQGAMAQALQNVDTADQFPQELLRGALALASVRKSLSKLTTLFESTGIAHFQKSGEFEAGKVAVTFPVTSKIVPKWKNEAITLAEELADVQGNAFVEEVFMAEVQERYEAKTKTSMKLTESV